MDGSYDTDLWTHVAAVASLPVLWQAAAAADSTSSTSGSSQDTSTKLCDIVCAASTHLSNIIKHNATNYSSQIEHSLLPQFTAACELLAAAVQPQLTSYQDKQLHVSPHASYLLASQHVHGLIHDLLNAVEHGHTTAWHALRYLCAQCLPAASTTATLPSTTAQQPADTLFAIGRTANNSHNAAGSSSDTAGLSVQQLQRVVTAYMAGWQNGRHRYHWLNRLRVLLCYCTTLRSKHLTSSSSSHTFEVAANCQLPWSMEQLARLTGLGYVDGHGTEHLSTAQALWLCSYAALSIGVLAATSDGWLCNHPAVAVAAMKAAGLAYVTAVGALAADAAPQAGLSTTPSGIVNTKGAQAGQHRHHIEGAMECALAAVQALVLLSRHGSANTLVTNSRPSQPVRAHLGDKATLDNCWPDSLRSVLEQVVSLEQPSRQATAAGCRQCASPACASCEHLSSTGPRACKVQDSIQQQLREELKCWSAVALSTCFGQLGVMNPQGRVLAAARNPEYGLQDAILSLKGGTVQIPLHSTVAAARCRVLKQRLLAATASSNPSNADQWSGQRLPRPDVNSASLEAVSQADGSSSKAVPAALSQHLQLKLGPAVDPFIMNLVLDYVYMGQAHVPVDDDVTATSSSTSGNPSDISNKAEGSTTSGKHIMHAASGLSNEHAANTKAAATADVSCVREQLYKLSKALQVPMLAALCRPKPVLPGHTLGHWLPDFAPLLPSSVLLQPISTVGVAEGATAHVDNSATRATAVANSGFVDSWVLPQGQCSTSDSGSDVDVHIYQPDVALAPSLCKHDWPPAAQSKSAKVGACTALADATASSEGAAKPPATHVHMSTASYLLLLHVVSSLLPTKAMVAVDSSHRSCFEETNPQTYSSVCSASAAQPAQHAQGRTAGAASHLAAEASEHTVCVSPLTDVLLAAPVMSPLGAPCTVFLPAHRVLLSASCQYFEALFSSRWHPTSTHAPMSSDPPCTLSAMSAVTAPVGVSQAAPTAAEGLPAIHQQKLLPVVIVPDADAYVAAAMLRWLYTGHLQFDLPGIPQHQGSTREECATLHLGLRNHQGGLDSHQSEHGASNRNGDTSIHGGATVVCRWCHSCRSSLRLWHCAELLLLPQLQQQCLQYVTDSSLDRLPCGCLLTLLQDAVTLGVPQVAEQVFQVILQQYDEASAVHLEDWEQLHDVVQAALQAKWVEKRRGAVDGSVSSVAASVSAGGHQGGGSDVVEMVQLHAALQQLLRLVQQGLPTD